MATKKGKEDQVGKGPQGKVGKEIKGTNRKAEKLIEGDPKFHSLLGTTNFREFLVYDVSQIYPEYILYYKPAR